MPDTVKAVLVEEATPEQFREFATQVLNLDISPDASDADVRAAVDAAQPNAGQIFVLEREPESEAEEGNGEMTAETEGRMVGSLGRGDPRFKINIPVVETNDKSGQADVFVGVNGRNWQIRRGVDAVIPARVMEALMNAAGTRVQHDHLPDGSVEESSSSFQRFPVQVIERPSEAEMKAWHERIDDDVMA